jgi:DNA-binding response OmpR family regulator
VRTLSASREKIVGTTSDLKEGAVSRGRVLAIDDDEDTLALLSELLERAGFEATVVASGQEGLAVLQAGFNPDVVILDITMPGLDGWGVLERIRSVGEVPVLVLTSRAAELERVRGLRSGADDYVVKPFGRQELIARVEALLRRARDRTVLDDLYEDPLLRIDFLQRQVQVAGVETHLTPHEFRLLAALVRHTGKVVGHAELLELVWRDAFGISHEEVRTYVSYLRRKLREAGVTDDPIETVRGVGYRYRVREA